MKFIKYYLVPIIIIGVALFQIYEVNNNGLTRWKGGGFGMYSEHHFFDNEIWINEKIDDSLNNKGLKKSILNLKRRPNEINAIKLIEELNLNKDTILLQVWKPKFELTKLNYRRELLYEITYYNN